MSLSSPNALVPEVEGESILLYNSLDGADTYGDILFNSEPEKTDIYGNRYFESDDGDLFEVEPCLETVSEELEMEIDCYNEKFRAEMKQILTFFHNFDTLRRNDVSVPDFYTGIHTDSEQFQPFFVMEKSEGQPLSEVPEKDEIKDIMERYNDTCRILSANDKFVYPKGRIDEDLIVDRSDDELEIIQTNPGFYICDGVYHNQFRKSDRFPPSYELSKWFSPGFWEK